MIRNLHDKLFCHLFPGTICRNPLHTLCACFLWHNLQGICLTQTSISIVNQNLPFVSCIRDMVPWCSQIFDVQQINCYKNVCLLLRPVETSRSNV